MNINRLSRISLGSALLLMVSSWSLAEPSLNGLAVNTELNKERFIAALYSDTLSSNADAILNTSGQRRMELKVTDSRLSARSLNSMWIEGMAINNRSSDLESQAENLAKLTNMIRKRLEEGDVLRLDAVAGKGTTVSLNGIELGIIESDAFFPLLLRTWIGGVPLSSEFKTDLLANGKVDSGLRARYESIEPDQARIDTVSTWTTPKVQSPALVASEGPSVKPPAPAVAVAAPPPTPTLKPPVLDTPKPAAAAASKTAATEAATVAAAAAAPAIIESKPTPKPEQTVALAAPAKPAPAPVDADDEEEAVFSASSLLERQLFVNASLIAIQKNVEYPRRALDREQQGSVRLAVTIARNGDLLDIQTLEEARHSLLNRAAEDAVKETKFSPMPAKVTGDSITFTAPISFALK